MKVIEVRNLPIQNKFIILEIACNIYMFDSPEQRQLEISIKLFEEFKSRFFEIFSLKNFSQNPSFIQIARDIYSLKLNASNRYELEQNLTELLVDIKSQNEKIRVIVEDLREEVYKSFKYNSEYYSILKSYEIYVPRLQEN